MDSQIKTFDQKIDSYRAEVLWRIQNAEELIKSRISEVRVNDIINTLRNNIVGLVSN